MSGDRRQLSVISYQLSVISYQLSVISYQLWFFGLCYAMSFSIRVSSLIEKDIDAIFVNCFRSRTN
ncbi:unknown protein [Microcystis aeruginosa NIES-843]|uniref:Uncharacterized protein n=1 Tax=Microcystis aeruginosa (strain NIES-843 / IAM M-2473) TaxID=449447 RepID=B0JWG9_MICAN|nr:unknown protein [Microcystis aeruginosa NIES-843]